MAEAYSSQILDYSAAAHCYEELVLLAPDNAHNHSRLAECYFTMGKIETFDSRCLASFKKIGINIGDIEHLLLARKHYTISLNLQAAQLNIRALYGLCATCRLIKEQYSAIDEHEKKVNDELLVWTAEQMKEISSNNNLVANVFQSLLG